jgi:hypothetical protein
MTGSLSFHAVPTTGRRDHLAPVGRSSDPGQDKGLGEGAGGQKGGQSPESELSPFNVTGSSRNRLC